MGGIVTQPGGDLECQQEQKQDDRPELSGEVEVDQQVVERDGFGVERGWEGVGCGHGTFFHGSCAHGERRALRAKATARQIRILPFAILRVRMTTDF